jgi:hypothetical protein
MWCIILSVALLAVTVNVQAQGPVSVSGVVANEAARPIQHALVTLDPQGPSRQVRADRDGRFSFLGVPAGEHVLRVTWVGFAPDEQRVQVGGTGVNVEVTLRRLTRLDTTVVTARRTGIYGSVISIDSLLPVAGARVEIIGDRKADSTNSSGTFNFPGIRGGSYIVRIKHPFFDSRNFSVVVPVDGGTELDVVLERGRVSRDAHMEMLYREMDSRLNMRGINSAFVTREALKGREKMTLDKALAYAPEVARKALYIAPDACLFVDGIARPGATIESFAPEDIESIELYGAPARKTMVFINGMPDTSVARSLKQADPTESLILRWPPKVPCGREPLPSEQRQGNAVVKVMFAAIWLRR